MTLQNKAILPSSWVQSIRFSYRLNHPTFTPLPAFSGSAVRHVVKKRALLDGIAFGTLVSLFLRRNRRTHKGETYEYWSLMRTVRTAKGPRHELVAKLGKASGLDENVRRG